MLIQLTYASRVARSLGPADVKDILGASRRNNESLGVSGALCLHSGVFLQMLEGDRTAVSTLYQRILLDARHKEAVLLDLSEVPRRRFTRWSMGLLASTEDNRELFMRYSPGARFDPYEMSAASVRALFDEALDNVRWIG
jgi:hypothetical protein